MREGSRKKESHEPQDERADLLASSEASSVESRSVSHSHSQGSR